ncbi:MAG TPA: pyrroline-5-carboxylate reductase [Bdellovibrionota bacterium]|jgi:pyrroline-5-carboxylate reductase
MSSLGILGVGTMGEALIKGIQGSSIAKQFTIAGSTKSEASAAVVAEKYKIDCGTDNARVVKKSDVLLLAVKPHQAEAVLAEAAGSFRKGQLLISICAALTLDKLRKWSGGKCALVRAMPNTPAIVGEGMTVFCAEKGLAEAEVQKAEAIFSTMGSVARLEESLMDAATGLSGCGPAYVFLMIEALSEAGVKLGIPRKTSTLLAAQTLMGSAKMVLERGEHPAAMKDEVTTPAGCTIDGLMALEEGKLRVTLIKGVLAAAKRSSTLV